MANVIILITQETQEGHKTGGHDLEATRDTYMWTGVTAHTCVCHSGGQLDFT